MKTIILLINIVLIVLCLLLIIGYEQIAHSNQELYWIAALVALLLIREYIKPISKLNDHNDYDERDIYRD